MKRNRHDAEHAAGHGGIGGHAVFSDVCMGATFKIKMKRMLFFWFIVLTVTTLYSQEKSFPKLTGPYLGQDPPGTTPEIFAPGIVSLPEFTEYSSTFSPDGMPATIYCSKVIAGEWTNPEPVDFSSGYAAYEPHISFDNESLYFAWEKGPGLSGIWVTERVSGSWSEPKHAGQGMFVSSDSMGNIYLTEIIDRLRPATGEIAYAITPPDGNAEIFLINADGTGRIQLTDQPGRPYGPAFSPDATKIAFYNHLTDQTWSLYLMNADGTSPIQLTDDRTEDWWPKYSPDGSKIVFQSRRDGNHEIYVMNCDGSNPVRLTNNSADDEDPNWSPDGTKIAFISMRDGHYEIYTMNADGSNQTRITTTDGHAIDPDWK